MLNYAENMLKLKRLHFPVKKERKKTKNCFKNHKMQKFDMKFHKWREAPDQRKPPLILIIAG